MTSMSGGPVSGTQTGVDLSVGDEAAMAGGADPDPNEPKEIIGRSPGQLAWRRLRREKSALVAGIISGIIVIVAFGAPIIEKIYGQDPTKLNSDDLDGNGRPLGLLNGVSGEHWLGLQPGVGRDVFMQIVYGMRTSLIIALIGAVVTIAFGAIVGAIAGYFGGKVDAVINWITDVALAFPFVIMALAVVPVLGDAIAGAGKAAGTFTQGCLLIGVFLFFGWMGTARLVRGQVISLREREFVEAARASGAGSMHIIFKQILPNVWAPILVTFSLLVPQLITSEAALSFLGIGIPEPTPDLGRIISDAVDHIQGRGMWFYFVSTGGSLFLLVLTFNLLGDSVRDALDPKSVR